MECEVACGRWPQTAAVGGRQFTVLVIPCTVQGNGTVIHPVRRIGSFMTNATVNAHRSTLLSHEKGKQSKKELSTASENVILYEQAVAIRGGNCVTTTGISATLHCFVCSNDGLSC